MVRVLQCWYWYCLHSYIAYIGEYPYLLRAFRVESEVGSVGFDERRKPECRWKTTGSKEENNKPTNGVDTEIWNRATLVGGHCSHNYAIPAPPHWPNTSRANKVQTYSVWTAFASLSSTWPLNCLVVTYTVVSSTDITTCTHFLRGSRLLITKACPTSAVYCTCIWRTPVIHFKTNE